MARPKYGYKLEDGTRVPGVTTIIGRFKNSGALINWAYDRGLNNLPLYEAIREASDIGHEAHDMVEAFVLTGNEQMSSNDKVNQAYRSFREFWNATKIHVFSTETSMVSEKYRIGGTIDAVGRKENGECILVDWKTSGAIYPDYVLQIAAYMLLWNEKYPEYEIKSGYICRFSKNFPDFEARYFGNLELEAKAFLGMVELYGQMKSIEARVR